MNYVKRGVIVIAFLYVGVAYKQIPGFKNIYTSSVFLVLLPFKMEPSGKQFLLSCRPWSRWVSSFSHQATIKGYLIGCSSYNNWQYSRKLRQPYITYFFISNITVTFISVITKQKKRFLRNTIDKYIRYKQCSCHILQYPCKGRSTMLRSS